MPGTSESAIMGVGRGGPALGEEGVSILNNVRSPSKGHLGVRPQGQVAWNHHPWRTGFDLRPSQQSQVRIRDSLCQGVAILFCCVSADPTQMSELGCHH